MKKTLYIILTFFILLIGFVVYKFYWRETSNLNPIYLIPKDAVYIVQTDDPVEAWSTLSESEFWQYLRTNTYFAELTSSANLLDTLIQDNKNLLDLLGKKELWVSAHVLNNRKFDHLYVIDLGKASEFTDFRTIIKKLINQHFEITDRTYQDINILELFDNKTRETLYMAVIDNNLVLSYTAQLVEGAISQRSEPVIGRDLNYLQINKKISTSGETRFFTQWQFADEFAKIFDFNDNTLIKQLSNTLYYSGLDVSIEEGKSLIAKGYTNINEDNLSYLLALQKAGTGNHSIEKIAPARTGAYLSFGFDSYQKFYEHYLELQKTLPELFDSFMANKKKIEDFLDIDLEEHFISWIDDEVALLKFETETFGPKNDFALIIKAKSEKTARKNLNHIAEQIRKRSPLKFKEVAYKGRTITFMSVKGFFKFFFGGFFKKLDNPYYSIIDDYVVFTNHPNTLKYIINNFTDETTLSKSEQYRAFKKQFNKRSNVFAYVNTPMFYESFTSNFSGQTKADLLKNKTYFTGFTQIGFQLFPDGEVFKNIMAIEHQPWQSIEMSDEFNHWEYIKEEAMDIEEINLEVKDETEITIPELFPNDFNAKSYRKYYDNGALELEVPLKDGKKHGRFKSYYPNGELKLKGRFKNDKATGTWKKYDSIGNLVNKKRF